NLKSNGKSAVNHPVMQELKRIQNYTQKLRNATHGNKANMEVDKDAAARFIRGALAANEVADRKAEEEAEAEAAKEEPQGTHTRFDNDHVDDNEEAESSSSTKTTNRKRGMDPFHGYDNKKAKSG
ncbi:hypothetical protein BGX26_002200, partial [Mortierella sp. AD094]